MLTSSLIASCQWLDKREATLVADRFVRGAINTNSNYYDFRKTVDTDREFENLNNGFLEGELRYMSPFREVSKLSLKIIFIDQKYAKIRAIGTIRQHVMLADSKTPILWEIELKKQNGNWYVINARQL